MLEKKFMKLNLDLHLLCLEEVLTQIKGAVNIGLVINKSKAKYMKTNRNVRNLEQDLIINGHVFEAVQNFRYLGASINEKNLTSYEIKQWIATGNRCFCSLRQIFRSTAMSIAATIKTRKMTVKPVVVHGGWNIACDWNGYESLGTWEKKSDTWTSGRGRNMEKNQSGNEVYKDLDKVADIKNKRSEWIEHMVRMDQRS